MAVNPLLLLPIGAVYFVLYYAIFRFLIVKLNLKTIGREDDDEVIGKVVIEKAASKSSDETFALMAQTVLEGIGGAKNIENFEYCATRLRFEVKNSDIVDDNKIKSAGVAGIVKPGKNSVQVVVGTKVQFVYDELKQLLP
jgi:PTS system N-acetylglucosamine-specific IIC component